MQKMFDSVLRLDNLSFNIALLRLKGSMVLGTFLMRFSFISTNTSGMHIVELPTCPAEH